MANEVEIIVKVKDESSRGLNSAKKNAESAGSSIGKALDSIGKAFDASGTGVADFITKVGSGTAALGSLSAESTVATGGMNLVTGAITAAIGAAVGAISAMFTLAPAILAVGGAAGAAASAVAGLGATFAVLDIGLGGVSNAWDAYNQQQNKAAAGGGKAAHQSVSDARQVENAERSLVQAKRAEKDAADAVNRAREDEVKRLRDLSLSLQSATLDQADAAKALAKAKQDEAAGMAAGQQDVEYHNQLHEAVQRAQIAYEEATNKVKDLSEEQRKGAKQGVEGSDAVQHALEQHQAAVERVTQATEALADAHKKVGAAAAGAGGGVNVFDREMKKLSPNAQSVVRTMIELSKQFDVIKKQVQQHLFAGIAETLKELAGKWFPRLGPMLGGIADHLNSLGKGLAGALGNPTFIKNIVEAVKGFEPVIDDMGAGFDAFIDAFGRLARASVPVLGVISRFIRDIFVNFDKWITSADKSGKLDDFMQGAAVTLTQIFEIIKLVVKIAVQLIEIFFPTSKTAGTDLLAGVQGALQGISDWLANPKTQAGIKTFIALLISAIKHGIAFGEALVKAINWGIHAWHYLQYVGNSFMIWLGGLPRRAWHSLVGMWDGLKDGFRNALNWIISKWNNLHFGIPSFFGGGTIGVPQVPYLATGGISQGLAMINERGGELVRTPRGSMVLSHGDSMRALAGAGGGAMPPIIVQLVTDGKILAQTMVEPMRELVRARGSGSVQQFLGRPGVG